MINSRVQQSKFSWVHQKDDGIHWDLNGNLPRTSRRLVRIHHHHGPYPGDGSGDGDECAGTCQSGSDGAWDLLCGHGCCRGFLCGHDRCGVHLRVCDRCKCFLCGCVRSRVLLCGRGRDEVLRGVHGRDADVLCGDGHGRTCRPRRRISRNRPLLRWPRRGR